MPAPFSNASAQTCQRTACLRHPRKPGGEFEKDVKIVGTNSISSLESIKVQKNELQTNCKKGEKPRC
jgi:hypothetical protein